MSQADCRAQHERDKGKIWRERQFFVKSNFVRTFSPMMQSRSIEARHAGGVDHPAGCASPDGSTMVKSLHWRALT